MNAAPLYPPSHLPALPPFVAWSIEATGTVLSLVGPADDHCPGGGGSAVGADYRAAFADAAELCRLVAGALEGQAFAQPARLWGERWFHVIRPWRDERGVIGWVDGWSVLLPPDAEGERSPYSVYESMIGDPNYGVERCDRFLVRPESTTVDVVRKWSRERWDAYIAERADRLRELLTPASPPPPSRRSPGPARLRIL